jgi:hypothetical protein
VVRNLPNDKAPDTDGFNNEFIKRCWHFIKEDFYALCSTFQDNSANLQSINDSYITLIPKIDGAQQLSWWLQTNLSSELLHQIHKALSKQTPGCNPSTSTSKSVWLHQNKNHPGFSCLVFWIPSLMPSFKKRNCGSKAWLWKDFW